MNRLCVGIGGFLLWGIREVGLCSEIGRRGVGEGATWCVS